VQKVIEPLGIPTLFAFTMNRETLLLAAKRLLATIFLKQIVHSAHSDDGTPIFYGYAYFFQLNSQVESPPPNQRLPLSVGMPKPLSVEEEEQLIMKREVKQRRSSEAGVRREQVPQRDDKWKKE